MKKIFVIDWCMLFAFIATVITGFGMHAVGHGTDHWIWEVWSAIHILSAISFVAAGVMHIKTHWGWYKGWMKNGLGKKSHVTVILSVIYVVVLLSGVVLLAVEGANTHVGLFHYKIGIVLTAIGLGHFIKRFPTLRKSLKK